MNYNKEYEIVDNIFQEIVKKTGAAFELNPNNRDGFPRTLIWRDLELLMDYDPVCHYLTFQVRELLDEAGYSIPADLPMVNNFSIYYKRKTPEKIIEILKDDYLPAAKKYYKSQKKEIRKQKKEFAEQRKMEVELSSILAKCPDGIRPQIRHHPSGGGKKVTFAIDRITLDQFKSLVDFVSKEI